ncbi:MAG: pantoate--beta-alanine ligase [Pseudomonadota bacterium]
MSSPIVLTSMPELRAWRSNQTHPVHMVPTMGNLHEGHLRLVDAAGEHNTSASVVVSIFVNPTQFGPNEDFERYPRTLAQDVERLRSRGCDAVWAPTVDIMYPFPAEGRIGVTAPAELADGLCAGDRPGHFDGVVSVVLRLFSQVLPHAAFFGEKDYQQLQIIRRLASDLSLMTTIHAVETVRESDGLAMSSRNQYLSAAERETAAGLYRVLQEQASTALHASSAGTLLRLQRSGIEQLQTLGFEPEYFEFRHAGNLARLPDPDSVHSGPIDPTALRLLAAARLGSTRLIDNVALVRQK